MTKLGVNIDHIATIREARKTNEPDPVAAAVIAELAGADGITVHLRSDRRHIQDRDVELLRETVKTRLNLEMAATEEMVRIALEVKPDTATLVPEFPGEVTTQGGLDCVRNFEQVRTAAQKLEAGGVAVSPHRLASGRVVAGHDFEVTALLLSVDEAVAGRKG